MYRIALAVVIVGCSKRVVAPPGPVDGPEAAACTALVPAELREHIAMRGMRFEGDLRCSLRDDKGQLFASIVFACGVDPSEAALENPPWAGKAIPNLGRFAHSELDGGLVTTYASRADCLIWASRMAPSHIDLVNVAKVIDANLDAANTPKPKPIPEGGAALRCDTYIPVALREKYKLVRKRQVYDDDRLRCEYQDASASALRLTLACFPDRARTEPVFANFQSATSGNHDAAFMIADTNCAALVTSFAVPLAEAQTAIAAAITPTSIK